MTTERTVRFSTTDRPDLRYAIGLSRLLTSEATVNEGNYPPHNIEKLTDTQFVLVLAVAGFDRSEIELTLHKGTLRIKGAKCDESLSMARTVVRDIPVDSDDQTHENGFIKQIVEVNAEYLYRGIALRDFNREFLLGDGVEVKGVTLIDGLLTINLEKYPEKEDRPISIPIR